MRRSLVRVGTLPSDLVDANRSPDPRAGVRVGAGLRVLGEVLVTLGAVLLLFAAYQLWWTNVRASQAELVARTQAEQLISAKVPPGWQGENPPVGTPFALMYIPRLRDQVWATPVIQGVSAEQLAAGIGHYPATAMPGGEGNFSVAGHRATHGEPFANFDLLREGDRVYVQTRATWLTYSLQRDQIIAPSETWVIDPQPLPANPLPSQRLITLTTCNPRWASTQRWAFWGILTDSRPESAGPPPGMGA